MDTIQNNLQYRMDNIEKEIKHLSKTIDEKIPTIDQMKLANKELITEVLEYADKRYASKVTEHNVSKLLWSIIGLAFSIVLLFLSSRM